MRFLQTLVFEERLLISILMIAPILAIVGVYFANRKKIRRAIKDIG